MDLRRKAIKSSDSSVWLIYTDPCKRNVVNRLVRDAKSKHFKGIFPLNVAPVLVRFGQLYSPLRDECQGNLQVYWACCWSIANPSAQSSVPTLIIAWQCSDLSALMFQLILCHLASMHDFTSQRFTVEEDLSSFDVYKACGPIDILYIVPTKLNSSTLLLVLVHYNHIE